MTSTSDYEEALALISDEERFPNIPKSLIKHLEYCVSKQKSSRFIKVILEKPLETCKAIDAIFTRATEATGLALDELFATTDFAVQDCNQARVDSAFAEIRTINYLYQQEFAEISPLKGAKNKPRADILARRRGLLYVIEVADSNYYANGRVLPDQLARWVSQRFEEKKMQLHQSILDEKATHSVFVVVLDTQGAVALNTIDDYLAALERAYELLDSPANCHLCLMTGRHALGYGRDDVVYPGWEESTSSPIG